MNADQKTHVSFGRRLGGNARRRARRSNSAQKQMAVAATKLHAAALSAMLDVFFTALGIKQSVGVATAKVWLTRWRLGRRLKTSASNNAHFVARTFAAATATI